MKPRRFPALVLAVAILAVACQSPRPRPSASSTQAPPERPAEAERPWFPASPQAASVQGVIRWTGPRPPAERITMDAEQECAAMHPRGLRREAVTAARNGALSGAVVYIKRGLESWRFPPPSEAVLLEQKGCLFVPRVLALRTGQTLLVRNSDPVSHNVHPTPRLNRDWNQQQPPGAPDLQRRFRFAEVVIPVKCNVHSWMRSYLAVTDHPFVAVTGVDGKYAFLGLPPGGYTIAVWHEAAGEVEREVTLSPSAAVQVDFRVRSARPR